jgi:inosine-uridine nucleoside N-ribohydrolase
MQHLTSNIPSAYFAVRGCAALPVVLKNICAISELFVSCREVPVFSGKLEPYSQPPTVEIFFGDNGLNNMQVSPLKKPNVAHIALNEFGTDRELTWLETGPCTNLAAQLEITNGSIRNQLKRIVIMGGCFDGNGLVGKTNPTTQRPYAEFNVYQDAAALKIVLSKAQELKIEVVMVPWEECSRVQLKKKDLYSFSGSDEASTLFLNMTRQFFEIYGTDNMVGQSEACYSPADPIAFLAMLGLYGHEVSSWVTVESDNQLDNYGETKLFVDKGTVGEDCYPVKIYRINEPAEVVSYLYSLFGWAKI